MGPACQKSPTVPFTRQPVPVRLASAATNFPRSLSTRHRHVLCLHQWSHQRLLDLPPRIPTKRVQLRADLLESRYHRRKGPLLCLPPAAASSPQTFATSASPAVLTKCTLTPSAPNAQPVPLTCAPTPVAQPPPPSPPPPTTAYSLATVSARFVTSATKSRPGVASVWDQFTYYYQLGACFCG